MGLSETKLDTKRSFLKHVTEYKQNTYRTCHVTCHMVQFLALTIGTSYSLMMTGEFVCVSEYHRAPGERFWSNTDLNNFRSISKT